VSDYEKFQQMMFDQLDDLEAADQQRVIVDFVEAGLRVGIDVIAEIVDKKRDPSEVIAQVREKSKK
jgi:hypothetical protein